MTTSFTPSKFRAKVLDASAMGIAVEGVPPAAVVGVPVANVQPWVAAAVLPSKVSLLTTLAKASVVPAMAMPARLPVVGSQMLFWPPAQGLAIRVVVTTPLRLSLRTMLEKLAA